MSSGSTASSRRRYAIVGAGSRHEMYREAIVQRYAATAELVALCDANAGRLALSRQRAAQDGAPLPAGYAAADYPRLLAEQRPDVVIVTTPDATHHDYVVPALLAGCDVIAEKPMTTDVEKCRQILEARRRSGRRCRVGFNYRYAPVRSQVKDILRSGRIGEVLSIDFHWLLNTHHGADYFRRWHAQKRNSGGLFVHKATHHFDLVNWWLGAVPVAVMAAAKREFYTPEMARRLGLSGPHERCRTCPEAAQCAFRLDLEASAHLRTLYRECEGHDGYWRDRCVFRPEIDIADTMTALVTYDTGATLSYSLNTFNAWEGYTIAFNGTKGRLEHSVVEAVYEAGREMPNPVVRDGVTTRVIPLRGPAEEIAPWRATGDHGGGDDLMLAEIFRPDGSSDPYLRAADERDGAHSLLVGVAANRSVETGTQIRLADLVPDLPRPDYAPGPHRPDSEPAAGGMKRAALAEVVATQVTGS